ncbi:hypothetical protein BA20089_08270 [Bifidobacterium asteroides DSM 20089]|uniref:Uncharacterized protein n=1 Tax=Bifidobacterium asteroides DSM 20089 TaxID=1437594 RepID=A0AAD0EX19_9BIFI|nr:hypothetical protein BA20089_08270 [Bifidobacterium asteroides DSM 20089]
MLLVQDPVIQADHGSINGCSSDIDDQNGVEARIQMQQANRPASAIAVLRALLDNAFLPKLGAKSVDSWQRDSCQLSDLGPRKAIGMA